MYINFWYPIARATEILADKPLRVELLGTSLVPMRPPRRRRRECEDAKKQQIL